MKPPINPDVARALFEDLDSKVTRALEVWSKRGFDEARELLPVAEQAIDTFKDYAGSHQIPDTGSWKQNMVRFDVLRERMQEITRQMDARKKAVTDLPVSAANYLECQQWLLKYSKRPTPKVDNTEITTLSNEWMSFIYAEMRNARVFDLSPRAFATLYHTADVYTVEKIGNAKWVPQGEHDGIAEGEHMTVRDKIVSAGRHLPIPGPLPFPQVYFAFGGGVNLLPQQVFWHMAGNEADEEELKKVGIQLGMIPGELPGDTDFREATWKLLGFLVTELGMVVGFFEATNHTTFQKGIVVQTYRFPDPSTKFQVKTTDSDFAKMVREWYKVYSLTPWVVTSLVAVVNAHRTFIEQDLRKSLSYRMSYERHAKKRYELRKAIPPPFYEVQLQDQLIRHASRKSLRASFHWHLAHRFDVRGHERIKVVRGSLPLDPQVQHTLEKRKYVIFTLDEPDVETYRLLMQRGLVHKRPGEWLAVKRCWVKPFVKGPEDAPYVPSVRTVNLKKVGGKG